MRIGNKLTKKIKKGEFQKDLSIVENNQYEID